MLIVIEGVDGAGTTTQAKLLAEHLEGIGRKVARMTQPTKDPIGTFIREHFLAHPERKVNWRTLTLLFAADRVDQDEVVRSLLGEGYDVIFDRYVLSSFVYQALEFAPCDRFRTPSSDYLKAQRFIGNVNTFVKRPDLTIIVDVDADVAKARVEARSASPERFEDDLNRRKLVAGYRETASDPSIELVNGARTELEVHEDIKRLVHGNPGFHAEGKP